MRILCWSYSRDHLLNHNRTEGRNQHKKPSRTAKHGYRMRGQKIDVSQLRCQSFMGWLGGMIHCLVLLSLNKGTDYTEPPLQEITEPRPHWRYLLSAVVRASKLEATRGRLFTGIELILLRALVDLRCYPVVLLFRAKVVLNDVEGFLVYVQILVVLQELNLVQACSSVVISLFQKKSPYVYIKYNNKLKSTIHKYN